MGAEAERGVARPSSGPSTQPRERTDERKRCHCASRGERNAQCSVCGGATVWRQALPGAPPLPPPSSRHSLAQVPLFAPLQVSEPGDAGERAADAAATAALRRLDGADVATPALAPVTPALQRASDGTRGGGGLVVEDDAQTLSPGQMHKSELLALLRAEACAAADRALAELGRDTRGCPYVERWLGYYATRSAQQVERALRKYAPEASAARSARELVGPVSARIERGARAWAQTGRLPDDVPGELRVAALGGGLGGAVGAVGGMLGAVGSAVAGVGKAIGGLLFKGAGAPGVDRAALSAQLGPGRPLETGARTRMEMAFGASFAHVRVHSDDGAAQLSRDLRARAFTLGDHVAFGAGEYRPGTHVGDALLAHELAHVVQQGGAGAAPHQPLASTPAPALEHEADDAAAGALEQLWIAPPLPRQRRARRVAGGRGLRLQRCASAPKAEITTGTKPMSSVELVALAQNESIPIAQRGIQLIQAMLATFYASEATKFKSVKWEADLGGLRTDCDNTNDPNVRCDLVVGEDFVKTTDRLQLSRRVMQLGHELRHVDQQREGMGGDEHKAEREFLAFYWEATAPIPTGLKPMQHTTRVNVIDGAIRAYNCFDDGLKTKYRAKFDELVQLRESEVKKGHKDKGPVPTDCQTQTN